MPYIGRSTEAFGVRTRYTYTPSAGDTSVSGADVNGLSLSFTDGAYVDVFLNGVRLKHGTDYVTTTANTIGSLAALAASDEVEVVVFDVFSLADMVSSANGGNFFGQVNFKTDGAVLGFGADSDITLTHHADNGLRLKTVDTSGVSGIGVALTLQTGDTDIAQGNTLGTLAFQAPDEATGTDAILVAASIAAVSEGDFSSSNNATKLSFRTAASESAGEKMAISSGGDLSMVTDGAALKFGADSEITVTHNADTGLLFKHTATSGTPPTLTFQTGTTNIAQDSVLGRLLFQAPDEGTGTDAITSAARIQAISEGDFSSSSNATSIEFRTATSGVVGTAAQGSRLTLQSDANLVLKDMDTADGSSPSITLQTGDTDIAQDDILGTINFQAPDEGTGTDAILVAAGILAKSEGDFSSSSNATSLFFKTGSSEAATNKLQLTSGGDVNVLTDGASIFFGADSEIELRHVADDGLILKHVGTGDGKEPSFSFQAGDNDIAQDDVLGQINFQAPDEGAGTDAILVAASIKAFSEGDFSASNNATTLEFATGRSAAAGSDGGRLQLASTGNLTLKNQNTADDSFPTFTLQTGDTDIAQGDVLGRVSFIAPDEGTGTDAITLAAAIDAESEGDFSSSSNATSLVFATGSSGAAGEKMRLTSAGNLRLASAGDFAGTDDTIQLGDSQQFRVYHNGGGGNSVACILSTANSMQVFSDVIRFSSADNSESLFGADKDGAFFAKFDNVTLLQTIDNGFKSDRTAAGGGVFNSDTGTGIYTFNTTSTSATIRDSSSIQAVGIDGNNGVVSTVSGGDSASFGRQVSDGDVITIRQAGTAEGTISVSGSTVSYNAFTGSHWSRLTDNSKPTILRGTVMETIDEMCDWYHVEFTIPEVLWKKEDELELGDSINPETGEPYFKVGDVKIPKNDMKCPYEKPSNVNEGDTVKYTHEGVEYDAKVVKDGDVKHVKSKISDTADCTNVYGVFFNWDNDDDTVNDMYVNALGTSLVRIHKDQTVSKGDLLTSNGDGTAKKQDDDIIRTKTIGKVLTNIKQETYSDGSYTVPCALYCG